MANTRSPRVLVVDDSAYVRKVVTQMLSRSPFLEVVGTARDGQEALDQVVELEARRRHLRSHHAESRRRRLRDREQMARQPLPIVIVSVASESGELVLNALDAGAVDFVQKPTALASERLLDMSEDLIEKVKARRRRALAAAPCGSTPAKIGSAAKPSREGVVDIVVLGISTGGPQALRNLDSAAAGGTAGTVGDRAAHAGRLHGAVRAQARRAVAAERRARRPMASKFAPEPC